jgi:cation:H+ antiporter
MLVYIIGDTMIVVYALLLIVGFVFLIKGADMLVDGAASAAENFKVPKMLIGLTIIAFGTSTPEFAVSISSLAKGSTDIVFGNVIGSNIINSFFILGIAAVIREVTIKRDTVKKELPILILISTLLVVLFLDIKLAGGTTNQITRADAFVILLFFSIFIYYLIGLAKSEKHDKVEKPRFGLFKSLAFVIIGLGGIIVGADMVVNNATKIATILGWSQRLIAITIISLGTTLPELTTTIVSSRKGEQDLLLGNLIGSNIFNICVVLGIPVAIFGTITPTSLQKIDLAMLVISSIILYVFAKTKMKVGKLEGVLMLVAFAIYYVLVFII